VLADNATLSHTNMAAVQQRLPNRNGMGSPHNLWPGGELGGATVADVNTSACMHNCAASTQVVSQLPDHARDAHGNLAQQQRLVGAQRGMDTGRVVTAAAPADARSAPALAQQHNCLACHGLERKILGPGLLEVAQKYAGRSDALAYLTQKIQAGGQGVWGAVAMPAQSLPAADAQAIARWLVQGAGR
jgi:S-disulfanyl-L-cysteine oxidoreductase SoxD